MAALIKFFLILFLVFFILSRVATGLLRFFMGKNFAQQQTYQRQQKDFESWNKREGFSGKQSYKKSGDIEIDYVPPSRKKRKSGSGPGEYVDYEEV